MVAETGRPQAQPQAGRSHWKLYLLILVCVAPVIASYLAYYVFPPSERTNYGALIEPQRPVPPIAAELVHAPAGAAAAQQGVLHEIQNQNGPAGRHGPHRRTAPHHAPARVRRQPREEPGLRDSGRR